MYRYNLTTVYEKLTQRQAHKEKLLLTEVLNSDRNREYFFQNFCQLTINLSDYWNSVKVETGHMSEKELLRQEGEFILLQLERKKIYVGVDFLGPIHDMMLQAGLTSRFKRIRSDFYAGGFEDFQAKIQQLAHNKYADKVIADRVKAAAALHVGYVWFVSDVKNGKVTVSLTRSRADLLFNLILSIFNKRRDILPKKDIFQYAGNLYDLITELNLDSNRKSQREIKKGDATIKDVVACQVYKDSNVWVIEPKRLIKGPGDGEGLRRAAEMCHTYFGIFRTSLIDGQTKPGSKWCTAVSPDPGSEPGPGQFGSRFFLNKYLFEDKNNLYYFVDLREDKIYALRTSGGNEKAIERVQKYYMKDPELVNDPKKMFVRIMMNMTEEVITAAQISLGSLPNLLQKFGLSLQWAQDHIKFVDMPETTPTQPTQQELDKESNLV